MRWSVALVLRCFLVYDGRMKKKRFSSGKRQSRGRSLPVVIERDEGGMYVVECPILSGCYSQGKTLDEALRNIQEVVSLVCEEEDNRAILRDYLPREISFHTITV